MVLETDYSGLPVVLETDDLDCESLWETAVKARNTHHPDNKVKVLFFEPPLVPRKETSPYNNNRPT